MQYTSLPHKHLVALAILITTTIGLLWYNIYQYNNTFFVGEQADSNQPTSETFDIIPLSSNDPIEGTLAAPMTIIGFEDFLCETCRVQHTYISELLMRYPGQVKFIWKDLSISSIPMSSELFHIYGYCMNEQGLFSAYKAAVFGEIFTSVSDDMLNTLATNLGANARTLGSCVNSEAPKAHLEKNKLLARALNIQRTPTFFVNGTQIPTPTSLMGWEEILSLRAQ